MSILKEILDKCKQALFIKEEDIQVATMIDEHSFSVQFTTGEKFVLSK